MKKMKAKTILAVLFLIVLTCSGLVLLGADPGIIPFGHSGTISVLPGQTVSAAGTSAISVKASLAQGAIVQGRKNNIHMNLELCPKELPETVTGMPARNLDMVVVLDRSGSMGGDKIRYAKEAVLRLISLLSPEDRFGLVTYSSGVSVNMHLLPVTDENRAMADMQVSRIYAGGDTNLGAGLETGIRTISTVMNKTKWKEKPECPVSGNAGEGTGSEYSDRVARIILISDGLANQGITDPKALSKMASDATRRFPGLSISTVGVGAEFNEFLMTSISDNGRGNYHFLENVDAFASVFGSELRFGRMAAATGVEVRIPSQKGIHLTDASGYPIREKEGYQVFYPGDIHFGNTRKLFLTYQVDPADETVHIKPIAVSYRYRDKTHTTTLEKGFELAVVSDPEKAVTTIQKPVWEEKILKNDFARLKEEVARDIKTGDKDKAITKIRKYQETVKETNAHVQSPSVAQSVERDAESLVDEVNETFRGSAREVEEKQKINSKRMQYEGYRQKRF